MDLYHIWCNLRPNVSKRSGRIESLHAAVNQAAQDLTSALYRDFPDSHRPRGEEKFSVSQKD